MKTPEATNSSWMYGHRRIKPVEGERSTNKLSLQAQHRAAHYATKISDCGQRVINLAYANELTTQLPNAVKNPRGFRSALKQGFEDIKRIIRLFSEVLTLLKRQQ